MLCACVKGVMDVVFCVCIVMRGAVWCMLVSCDSPQCCVLHDMRLFMLVEDAKNDHMREVYS